MFPEKTFSALGVERLLDSLERLIHRNEQLIAELELMRESITSDLDPSSLRLLQRARMEIRRNGLRIWSIQKKLGILGDLS